MGCERSHCVIHCCYPSIFHTVRGNWTTLVPGRASSPTATTFLCIEFLGSLVNLSVWLDSFCLSFATRDMVLSSTSLTYASTTPSPPPSSTAAPLTSVFRNGAGATPAQHNTILCNGVTPQVMGRGRFTRACISIDPSTRVNDVVVAASDPSLRHCILLVTVLRRLVLLWTLGLASHASATLGNAS